MFLPGISLNGNTDSKGHVVWMACTEIRFALIALNAGFTWYKLFYDAFNFNCVLFHEYEYHYD